MHVDLGVLLGHCVHVRYDIKNLSEEVVKHIAPNKIVSGKVDLSSDRKTPRGYEISAQPPPKKRATSSFGSFAAVGIRRFLGRQVESQKSETEVHKICTRLV